MITMKLIDNATVRLKAMPESIRKRLRVVIVRNTQRLAAKVRAKLNGGVLKKRSGRLFNSIKSEMHENNDGIWGEVKSVGVVYAGIHERGGRTKPHIIRPKNAKALHFMIGGKGVFAMMVNHPGSKLPQRSYLRSSLAEMRSTLRAEITEAGRPEWRG